MANFGDMITDLQLLLMGNQTDESVGKFLNRAHQQILEAHNWSFLLTNCVINTVAPKTAGSPWAKELYEQFAPVRRSLKGLPESEINRAIDEAVQETRAQAQ